MILNFDRFIVLTLFSLASLPRLSTLAGSDCSASAMDFNSAAVSGSRGSCASCTLSTPSSFGLLRRFSGMPRVTLAAATWIGLSSLVASSLVA